ncbi:MAG: DUF6379 domain-containing protein [Alteraurantiacibacter sp.]|nr:DUF6379 domain-containing protein [Alteraurantiacibacter sp.]
MLPVEIVIGEEGLAATPAGTRLAMRLPWYRSLPFSVVEVAGLTIDGQGVDLSDARVEYGGTSWPLTENGEKVDTFWFVRDSAFLVLPSLRLEPGSRHEVSLTLRLSPPYIPGMTRVNPQTATLCVAA